MAAIETFQFSGFTLRPAGARPADITFAHHWTESDPAHRGKTQSWFWLDQKLYVDCYLLLDAEGPLFFFRAERPSGGEVAIVHIQFPPTAPDRRDPDDAKRCFRLKERVRRGMIEGMPWLERMLAQGGIQQIVFESESRSLIGFVTRELGFTVNGSQLAKRISS